MSFLHSGATSRLHRNPFIETALAYALTYASTSLTSGTIEPSCITILADNDYCSQEASQQRVVEKSGRERFNVFNTPLEEAYKTGLGSSAALVTAFIAAILIHYLPKESFSLSTGYGKARLFSLAQTAHNAAQGKVDSGFDIASAVYGSCIHRRSAPSLLDALGDVESANFARSLKEAVDGIWPLQIFDRYWEGSLSFRVTRSSITIPQGIRLVMCDTDCGSKTPGIVKKVLRWRESNPEDANDLWNRLQTANDHLAAEFVMLAKSGVSDYGTLKQLILDIRAIIREMSTMSDVPVEPKAQTELLGACSKLPGIIGGVVPGAGGYDAIALLVEDKADVLEALSRLLASWKGKPQGGSDGSIGRVRLLGVREVRDGVRLENPEEYKLTRY